MMGTPGAAGQGGDSGLVHFEDDEGHSYDIPASNVEAFKQLMRQEYIQLLGEPDIALEPMPPGMEASPARKPSQPNAWDYLDDAAGIAADSDAGAMAGSMQSDLDAGAGVDAVAGSSAPPPSPPAPSSPSSTSASRAPPKSDALAKSRALNDELDHWDRTERQGFNAPAKKKYGVVETVLRSNADIGGFGFDDTMARIGATVGHLAQDRKAGRGVNAPLKPFWEAPVSEALDVGREAGEAYEAESQAAFEQQPVARFLGAVPMAMAQGVLMRRVPLPVGAAARESAAAAEAAKTSDWVGRASKAVIDSVRNPGTLGSSVVSGIGHASGETPGEFALSAAGQTAGEVVGNAAMAYPTELALQPVRSFGRNTLRKLRDPIANKKGAPLVEAAMEAGADFETFAKPANGLRGRPLTSERGIRGGPVQETVDWTGSAQPVQKLRAEMADQVTKTLEKQRAGHAEWGAAEKRGYYPTPEAQAQPSPEAMQSLSPQARQFVKESLENRGALRPGYTETPEQEVLRRRGLNTVSAQDLDEMISAADQKAKAHRNLKATDEAAAWDEIARQLRDVRNQTYFGLRNIDNELHGRFNRWEADASQMGLDPRTSPVITEPGGPHAQQVYTRLGQAADDPFMQSTLDRLRNENSLIGSLADQSRGVAAVQSLVEEAKKPDNAAWVRLSGEGKGLSLGFPGFEPGPRAAGAANLGLNTQAALREAASSPAALDYLYRWLGFKPDNETSQQRP